MASLLLTSLGWVKPSPTLMDNICHGRKLIIISHTSYYDFFLLLLYRIANEKSIDNLYSIMKPQLFELFGSILTRFNFIPSTRLEKGGNGFVTNMVNRFKDRSDFKLVISPKGKVGKGPWRSGYYYIRDGLKCDITTVGLDYEKKSLYVGPIHKHDDIKDMSRDELDKLLATDLGKVVPLHIENSDVDITRNYQIDRIGLINWPLFLLIIIIVVLLIITIYLLWRQLKNKH